MMATSMQCLKEQANFALNLRASGIASGRRADGCPVWDELAENLFMRILNDEFDNVDQVVKENARVMEHCNTCRHPMCIKALFGDVEPEVAVDDDFEKYGVGMK